MVSLVSKTDKEYYRVVKRFWVVNIHVVRSLVSKTDKEYFRVVKSFWVVKVDVVSCNLTSKQPLGSSRVLGRRHCWYYPVCW